MRKLGRKFYEVLDQLDLSNLSVIDRNEIEAIKFELDRKRLDKAAYAVRWAVRKSD